MGPSHLVVKVFPASGAPGEHVYSRFFSFLQLCIITLMIHHTPTGDFKNKASTGEKKSSLLEKGHGFIVSEGPLNATKFSKYPWDAFLYSQKDFKACH